jgi:DNA-binding PadR family transcriptional regulator
MLEDMGYVSASERDGKKVYTVTAEGLKFLKEQADVIDKIKDQMSEWWHPRNIEEFHDTIDELRGLGRLVGRKAHHLGTEKWTKIKDIVMRARRDIEEILGKE